MLVGSTTKDFASRVVRAFEDAGGRGVRVTAGSGGGSLELQQLAGGSPEEERAAAGRPHHLETPPGPRSPGRPGGVSRLCYFLDGVQSSREIGRVGGAAPVVVATVAAAIVERRDRRLSRMQIQGLPVVVRAVILPRRIGDERVETLWDVLKRAGLEELGPEEAPSSPDLVLDSTEYVAEQDPSDYVCMKERARVRVRALRERLEGALLRWWEDGQALKDTEGWIAVDGQLKDIRESNRRAIGLIKSVVRPEFVGDDVGMVLDLEAGMRTTGFIPDWQLRRDPVERRASWYTRMWPPQQGADALGSLLRIEAHRDAKPREIDEITRWVLAERAPLAKPDPRWPAMIYPIHYVEKILKPLVGGSERAYSRIERRLAAAWPANRRN